MCFFFFLDSPYARLLLNDLISLRLLSLFFLGALAVGFLNSNLLPQTSAGLYSPSSVSCHPPPPQLPLAWHLTVPLWPSELWVRWHRVQSQRQQPDRLSCCKFHLLYSLWFLEGSWGLYCCFLQTQILPYWGKAGIERNKTPRNFLPFWRRLFLHWAYSWLL